ncbi:hypothetical protein BDV10DRAFT_189811 [Aspergillus recurvatus]
MPSLAGGHRLAIITNRIIDGKPVAFPNYRGEGHVVSDAPYRAALPQGEGPNPLLEEVIRCSAAAPG